MKRAAIGVLVVAGAFAAGFSQDTIERPTRTPGRTPPATAAREDGLRGRVENYVSPVDGRNHPYGVCATDESSLPMPLLIQVNPGLPTRPENESQLIATAEQFAGIAKKRGKRVVAIRPTGQGPGSLYQNYGEVDVLAAIRDVSTKYPIDPDRIVVTGHSMGGAATWYLLSHYPDLFAAGAPMAGYSDYRLWAKPGGYTYPMQPWEEPSWQARSAPFLIENFRHSAVWIVHGAWDRAVGGGVPVEQSRRLHRLLQDQGFRVKYTEIPEVGHSFTSGNPVEDVVAWLLEQVKTREPRHVSLATYGLRHNRSYWVTIDQLRRYGQPGRVDALLQDDGSLGVKTENVRTLSLGPLPGEGAVAVRIDGLALGTRPRAAQMRFRRETDGSWRLTEADLKGEKHHGASGPLSDIYFENVILVKGTIGSKAETFFNQLAAGNTRILFNWTNGGLHRGGIMGENTVELTLVQDVELTEEQMRSNNLLLFGTDRSNAILKRFRDRLPLRFEEGKIRVGERVFNGDQAAIFAVFPHPDNPDRYIAVHGGVTEDAITAGSHLSLQLLPDYLIYDGPRMIEWGFWNNNWGLSPF